MKNTIAMITASLGGFDKIKEHVKQSLPYDYHLFTDENFPRFKNMTPRLQAKIPKCFAWELVPNYDYYFWIDGNLTLTDKNALKYFYDNCQDCDIVVLRHHKRANITWEARYVERGLEQQSRYLVGRYQNEMQKEEMAEILSDKKFVDDLLVIGGVFMYRNVPKVQKMLKEWWYHSSRYNVMDQLSFSYLIKKYKLKYNALAENVYDCKYLRHFGHTSRS